MRKNKNALFVYFLGGIWKQICHILKQHPWICLTAKFCEIMKMAKFGTKNDLFGYLWTKNVLFGYFWAGIPKKLLSYLKLASLDLSCYKVCCKIKILKFETKNACIFGMILLYLKPKSSNLSSWKPRQSTLWVDFKIESVLQTRRKKIKSYIYLASEEMRPATVDSW